MTVGVTSLPPVRFDGAQPITGAFPTPLATVAVSKVATGTVNVTGVGAVTATSDCGVAETPACAIDLQAAGTDLVGLWALGIGLTLLFLAASAVALVRR
jgi:hypothetical protein